MNAAQKIPFSIPAGQGQEFILVADVLRLDTLPSGLLVGFNGALPRAFTEGYTQTSKITRLRIENSTGGTLAGEFTYGTGNISLPGVAAVIGTIALPSGASTAALQTTGNTSLASILTAVTGVATAALQTAGNTLLSTISTTLTSISGYLQTLANPTARTSRFVNFTGGGGNLVIAAGARSLDILNTHASIAITVQVTGQAAASLAAGKGVSFPLLHPRDTGHEEVTISGAAGATANVSYIG